MHISLTECASNTETNRAKMVDRDIGQRILNFFSSRSKKQENPAKIANALRVTKKALNAELYRLEKAGRVVRVQETPPLWCLADDVSVCSPDDTAPVRRGRGRPSPAREITAVDEELTEKVMKYLQDKGSPAKALEIAKGVGLGKARDVNPTIYQLERRSVVSKHPGKQPLWGLAKVEEEMNLDLNEPMDGETSDGEPSDESLDRMPKLEYQATGVAIGGAMCRAELTVDPPGASQDNVPVFQETQLFQTDDLVSDNSVISEIVNTGEAETKMDVEVDKYDSSFDRYLDASDKEGELSEDQRNVGDPPPVGSSGEDKPKTFRDIFHLDTPATPASSDESDGVMEEDIRETFLEAYKKENDQEKDVDSSVETSNGDTSALEASNRVKTEADLDESASVLTGAGDVTVPKPSEASSQAKAPVELGLSAALSPEESKACLTVLTQLASFPGMTNFVLKKKISLPEDQLNAATEKCLSLSYISGSTKLWKITKAGQNLVNTTSGTTENTFEKFESPAPVQKRSIVKTAGPPPSPLAILKSQGHLAPGHLGQGNQGVSETASGPLNSLGPFSTPANRTEAAHPTQSVFNRGSEQSTYNRGSEQSTYNRGSEQSTYNRGSEQSVFNRGIESNSSDMRGAGPAPLMSIQLDSVPLLKSSSSGSYTNSSSSMPTVSPSQTSRGFSILNSQTTPALPKPNSSSSGGGTGSLGSSGLWDDFQNEEQPNVSTAPAATPISFQGSSVPTQKSSSNQRELPGFKMKAFNQAPPKPEITGEFLNYPNQRTSHEVLRDIQKPKPNASNDKSKSAFSKGPPPSPMDILTKGLKKTDISPHISSEPPKTIYQQSMSMSAITNTSTFSRPSIPRPPAQEANSQFLSNQSRQNMNQSASLQTGLTAGTGMWGFKSLPPGTSPVNNNNAGGNALALSSESFAALNKNPVSALMEYAQSRKLVARIEVIGRKGSAHKPTFELAAFVGDRKFPSILCTNKKDGRKEACDVAMRKVIAEGQFKAGSSAPAINKTLVSAENMTHFDKIAALTHRGFTALVSQITAESFAGRKVIAGLVMKRSEADTGVLISLGTGNRCITGQQLSLQGNTINDSHAEIITRRGFMRFLYKQLLEYDPTKPSPLFEKSPSGKFRVKSNITFHLYISTAPCGDGALFSPRDAEAMKAPVDTRVRPPHNPTFSSQVQGLLRTKVEGGEGTIPVEPDFTEQTFDGIQRGERLRTMSCTDKICRWNVVGLQGALLSQFIDPVYLDSLTLGLLFDQGHLSRAVCCRVAYGPTPVDELLPQGYRLNHPWLGRVTACDPPREVQKTKALSVNWSFGDSGPEVTDGTKGLCYVSIEKGFFSRCSKKNLFASYKALCEKFGRTDCLRASNYNQAKRRAAEFNVARKAMLEKFRENKLGKWVSKPVEEEMFGFEES